LVRMRSLLPAGSWAARGAGADPSRPRSRPATASTSRGFRASEDFVVTRVRLRPPVGRSFGEGRKAKRALFQALVEQAEARAVPVQHLDAILTAVAEDEKMAGEGLLSYHVD